MAIDALFLFLSDHFVSAYFWEGHGCDTGERFENTDAGLAAFDLYLDQWHFTGPIYLLVDVTEEDLHNEVVPKLFGANKNKMLVSRSSRIFRNTPFHYGYSQGKVVGEKNKDRALFIGLTEPDRVLSWLNFLKKRHARIVGIISLPVLCQEIVKKIVPSGKDALLVMPNSGGLRQIFLRDGRMLVSRLSPIHARDAQGVQMFIHGEVSKMQGYLASLRLVDHSAVLDVYVLCRGTLLALLESGRDALSTYTSHPVDVDGVVRRMRGKLVVRAKATNVQQETDDLVESGGAIERLAASDNMEPFFCYFLRTQRIKNHYARPDDTLVHRTFRTRFWLRMASFAVLLLGVGIGGVALWDGFAMYAELPQLTRLADEAQLALQKVGVAEHGATVPADGGASLVVAVGTMDTVLEYAVDPQAFLLVISRVLTNHPELWIGGIEWFAGVPEAVDADKQGQGGAKRPGAGKTVRGKGDTPKSVQPGDNKPGMQYARLQGRIHPFSGNYRAAQEKIETFLKELHALPEVVEARVLSAPVDPRQNAIMDGGTVGSMVLEANFVLQVTLKIGGGKSPRS